MFASAGGCKADARAGDNNTTVFRREGMVQKPHLLIYLTHHKTAGIEVVKNKNIRRKACVEEKKERRAYNRDPSNCRCEL